MMKQLLQKKYSWTLVSISFLLLTSLNSQESVKDLPSIKVIANAKGVPSEMTMKELKSIMQGDKQRWPDGTKVSIAFMKANTQVGSATANKVLGMSGDQLNKYWLALVFQGKAKAPVFYGSSLDVENFVAENPGAIGIVEANYTLKSGQLVLIDGKKNF
jgi:ABC-type phosphate transport system substrate-binding protein